MSKQTSQKVRRLSTCDGIQLAERITLTHLVLGPYECLLGELNLRKINVKNRAVMLIILAYEF
jgi:hypothetical protein